MQNTVNLKEFQVQRKKKQTILSIVFVGAIIAGWINPVFGFCIPASMILGIGLGAFKGRKWCDWYCPRASFFDTVVAPMSPKKGIPSLLKNDYLRFIVLILLFGIMIYQIGVNYSDINTLGKFFVILLSATTLIGIILGILFHQRSWCSICPAGLLANIAGKNKNMILIDSNKCTECHSCEQVCPNDIKPYIHKDNKIVKEPDCFKCGTCIQACPNDALKFNK